MLGVHSKGIALGFYSKGGSFLIIGEGIALVFPSIPFTMQPSAHAEAEAGFEREKIEKIYVHKSQVRFEGFQSFADDDSVEFRSDAENDGRSKAVDVNGIRYGGGGDGGSGGGGGGFGGSRGESGGGGVGYGGGGCKGVVDGGFVKPQTM